MSKYCVDCGCHMSGGYCTNCHEEVFIMEQYEDLRGTEYELPFPEENSDFMKRLNEIKGSK